MKRRVIIKKLEEQGFRLKWKGQDHDTYYNKDTKRTVPVGRHREIDDIIAKIIFKEAGI